MNYRAFALSLLKPLSDTYFLVLVSDKTFLDNKNLGLVPFAGISPFWLFLFYHKLL